MTRRKPPRLWASSFLPSDAETQLPTPGVVERVGVGAAGEVPAGPSAARAPEAGERSSGPAGPARTKAGGAGGGASSDPAAAERKPSRRDPCSRPLLGRERREARLLPAAGPGARPGRLPGGGGPRRHGRDAVRSL